MHFKAVPIAGAKLLPAPAVYEIQLRVRNLEHHGEWKTQQPRFPRVSLRTSVCCRGWTLRYVCIVTRLGDSSVNHASLLFKNDWRLLVGSDCSSDADSIAFRSAFSLTLKPRIN